MSAVMSVTTMNVVARVPVLLLSGRESDAAERDFGVGFPVYPTRRTRRFVVVRESR